MLLSGNIGGAAVTHVFAHHSPQVAFRLLRVLSGLRIHLKRDVGLLSLAQRGPGGSQTPNSDEASSAGTNRWLRFPDFSDVLGTLEKVRCYSLCRRIPSRRAVADQLGWSEKDVKRAYDLVCKRLRGLGGIVW